MLKIFSSKILIFAFFVGLLTACSETAEQSQTKTPSDSAGKIVANGQCELKPPAEPIACTMQYDPVCGCDGKTYGNACSARGAGVPDSTPGACDDNLEK